MCLHGVYGAWEKALEPLELDLEAVINCCMGFKYDASLQLDSGSNAVVHFFCSSLFLPFTSGNIATGVCSGVLKVVNDRKVLKSSTLGVKEHVKACLHAFCLSEDKTNLEERSTRLVGDVGRTVEDPYITFVKVLTDKDCCCALYDATYKTKESKQEALLCIFQAPKNAPLKSKMFSASSKDGMKKKMTGI
ncbi:cofilin-1-like [Apodemus sylvaticus]|uniref:cofilin-1-like n=1 Tax=Apodemus sylvaticus TaxID=10129 RepID=UPI002243D88B|nr:cofilin-1-like [Apodemus sylvaticus]